jgi:hypothetical protein
MSSQFVNRGRAAETYRFLNRRLRGTTENLFASNEIKKRVAKEPAPMAPAQEQVWLRCRRYGPRVPFHNEVITIHRKGSLDISLLERCLLEIISRHEAWRSVFDVLEGAAVQRVQPPPQELRFEFHDLANEYGKDREETLASIVGKQAAEPFDLTRGPLLRFALFKIEEGIFRLSVVAHQLIIDGVSAYQIFPAELASLYSAYSQHRPSQLPDLPIQYSDFSFWQIKRLQHELKASSIIGRQSLPTSQIREDGH